MRNYMIFLLLCFSISLFSQNDVVELFPFVSRTNGKIGYMNKEKEIVIEPRFSSGTYRCNGYYVVTEGSASSDSSVVSALIDDKGNFLIDFADGYSLISVSEGVSDLMLVVKNNKWGYLNFKKQIVIPLIYDHLGEFVEGLTYARLQGRYGFVDMNNNIIIDFVYDRASDFGQIQPDGMRYAIVEENGKSGYINNKGSLQIPCVYDYASAFYNGIAEVRQGNVLYDINLNGDKIAKKIIEGIKP